MSPGKIALHQLFQGSGVPKIPASSAWILPSLEIQLPVSGTGSRLLSLDVRSGMTDQEADTLLLVGRCPVYRPARMLTFTGWTSVTDTLSG